MVLFSLLLAAAFGAMVAQRAHTRRLLGPGNPVRLDDEAQVAMHLAQHEARSRGLVPGPVHLLYALIQDEDIAAAIRRVGGDLEAIESRLFEALDEDAAAPGDEQARVGATTNIVAWAMLISRRHDRPASSADLWAGLVQSALTTARLTDAGGADPAEVLFDLVHGAAPEVPLLGRDAAVVLVNDDITSQELVVQILLDVFALEASAASARMLEAHERGSGIIGRYPVPVARGHIASGQRLARLRGSPLWLRLEP
jgi:ATP-dependent Clp protease adapter protein ClpS